MTEERKNEHLDGLDWDSALDEWDRTVEPPGVSSSGRDSAEVPPGAAASRQLYRPPRPAAGTPAVPRPTNPDPVAPAPPVPMHDLLDDDEGGATIIAAVPHELLVGAGREGEPLKSHGGGLGQLFSRGDRSDNLATPAPKAPSSTRRPPPLITEESVITSAQHLGIPLRSSSTDPPPPLRRPSHVDPQERVDAEGFYDPFADLAEPPVGGAKLRPPPVPADEAPTPHVPPVGPSPGGGTDLRPTYRPPREPLDTLGGGSEGGLSDADAMLSKLGSPAVPRDMVPMATAEPPPAPEQAPSATRVTPQPPAPPPAASAPPVGLADTSLADAFGEISGDTLLRPRARRYDPNEETRVGTRSSIAPPPPAAADAPPPGPELPPPRPRENTLRDGVTELEELNDDEIASEPVPLVRGAEKPAAEWLDAAGRASMVARAEWLEDEARALESPEARARGLIAASELLAIAGERERAEVLAVEARALAPTMALAHKQARGLLSINNEATVSEASEHTAATRAAARVHLLDAEAETAPTPEARAHAALLGASLLRMAGDEAGADARYARAAELAPNDVRGPLFLAVRALARDDANAAAQHLPSSPAHTRLRIALAAALRLRGHEAPDSDTPPLPNEAIVRARRAFEDGDLASAAAAIADLREAHELSHGALWLAAALGATRGESRSKAAQWLRALARDRSVAARRALAARGLELGLSTLVEEALEGESAFTPAERAVIARFVGLDTPMHAVRTLAASKETAPLASALAATVLPSGERGPREQDAAERAECLAGSPSVRAVVRAARLLSMNGHARDLEDAVAACEGNATASALALELSARAARYEEVSDVLRQWGADGGSSAHERALAAGLLAERAGDRLRAATAYASALEAMPGSEVALRALAAVDPSTDQRAGLLALADAVPDEVRAAILRLEVFARDEAVRNGSPPTPEEDAEHTALLEAAHRACPSLPIASFFAERIARRGGDVEGVLRWIRERHGVATDPLEAGMDAVREAFLVADKDRALAASRLEQAHRARPNDVALRELYERMANEAPADRAAWREQRAAVSEGIARALLSLEAAYEYERAGDKEGALRAAEASVLAGGDGIAQIARERAELEAGQVARLADELLTLAKQTNDADQRREAYERLSILDGIGREDAASANLWHRSILEEVPLHKASLRHLEHAFTTEGRDGELEPIAISIAKALSGSDGAESSAHAELAARLRIREGDWDGTRELVELAASQAEPSLWSIRMLYAHARARGDDAAFLAATGALLGRMTRQSELASLLVRGGDAAARVGDLESASALLERAAQEDPGDVVTWGLLADVRQRLGDARGAAEACENLARTSTVAEHKLLAWYDAGRIWLDEVKDADRAVIALEQASAIDVTFQDTFARLSALYAARKAQTELAQLLERRIARASDPSDRVAMEVERGRALLEVGDTAGARAAFQAALELRPDDPNALAPYADLCAAEEDWETAEQAWVRLALLLPKPDDQRAVYARLGDLYSSHAPNLQRAEVAYREVLKRAPDDVATMERLVDVYRRLNDAPHAVEMQQELLSRAKSPEDRRRRLVEMASLWETVGRDHRKAEQTLEAARRESPTDVSILRALVEFYQRHRQLPAISILLDRTAADVRRSFVSGRFAPALFELLEAAFELRGRTDAARLAAGVHAAFVGQPTDLHGADARAFDPKLDDLLVPEELTAAFRTLLSRTGDALDRAVPLDVRSLDATTLPPVAGTLPEVVGHLGTAAGLGTVRVYVSPKLGYGCVPLSSSPPALVLGEGLLAHPNERARVFLVARAIKLAQARAAALVRTAPGDLVPLVGAWIQAFNPQWTPSGADPQALADAARRLHAVLPRQVDPDVALMALEVAGTVGAKAGSLGTSALMWANRVALLLLGDPTAALDGIALSVGAPDGALADPGERAAWIAQNPEAKDLLAFAVSDAHIELRHRLGLDRG